MSESFVSAPAASLGNAQPRALCVLVADTSGSMQGESIAQLNEALPGLFETLRKDPLAVKAVDLAIIAAGGSHPQVIRDCTPIGDGDVPVLVAAGGTPLAEASMVGLDLMEQRLAALNAQGRVAHKPWMLLLTDGEPTDPPEVLEQGIHRLRKAQEARRLHVFAVGVQGARLDLLGQFMVGRPPLLLKDFRFTELMRWFATSLRQVSRSRIDDDLELAPVQGWAKVTA